MQTDDLTETNDDPKATKVDQNLSFSGRFSSATAFSDISNKSSSSTSTVWGAHPDKSHEVKKAGGSKAGDSNYLKIASKLAANISVDNTR